MTLKDFSGGVKSRVHPTLIQPTESQIYQNCDNEAGILQPIKAPDNLGISLGNFFEYYEAGDKIVSRDKETYFAEHREVMYILGATEFKKITKDGTESNVNMQESTLAPTITVNDIGSLKGTYTYCYTYYNDIDGSESRPSPISSELAVTDKSIEVSGIIVSQDPQTTHIRLYRVGGNLSSFALVTELSNSTNYFIDDISDATLAGEHILDTVGTNDPLVGMKYLTAVHTMLFASLNDKLYYSEVGKPYSWSRANYLDFEDVITGIGAVQNGILVFTKYKTYIVTGSSPSTFSRYLINAEQGCINHSTIQYVKNSLVWLSTDGVCMSNGGDIIVISQPRVGKLPLNSLNAKVFDGAYYLGWEDGTYIFDFRYSNLCVRTSTISGRFMIKQDVLYYKPYETYETKLHKVLGTKFSTMYYRSPIFTNGRFSEYKHYKDFYISYEGEIHLKIYLYTPTGITKVADKHLDSSRTQYNIKTLGTSSGYGMSLSIIGKGKVFEIDFREVGRENAK